uniref:AlNc14C53G4106 protein n=1 Tax=Albugo laibachii Nc14 TaxID=890382 RepID=F0WBR5_9STRA|nr:AlNc14C53G4106 [Albugo laibachii Nc14]|eukprot:CCA18592.1 AlNc14C53G4106 [Albugo laibachii Nc14]
MSTKISQSAATLLIERAKEALVKLVNEKAKEKAVDLLQKATRDNSLLLDIKKQCQNLEEKILDRFQTFEKEVDERIDREMENISMSHRVSSQDKEDISYSLKHTVAQMNAKLMKLQQHLNEDKHQHELSNFKIAEWMADVDSQLHRNEAELAQPKCITGSKNEVKGRKLPSTQELENTGMDDKHQNKLGDGTKIVNPQRDRKEVELVQREAIKGSNIPALEGEHSSRGGLKSVVSERNHEYKSNDHEIMGGSDGYMRTTTTQTDTPVLDSGEKSKKAPREAKDIEVLILSERKLEAASFQKRLAAELDANQHIVDAKLNTNQRVIEEKAVTMQRALEAKLRTHQQTVEARVLQFDKALKDATSEKRFLKSHPIIVSDTERDKHLDDQLRKLISRIKYLEDEIHDIKEPLATLITNLGEENAALMEEIQRTQVMIERILV